MRGAAAVGEGQGVLGGERDAAARSAVALGEAGVLDQPGGAGLDRAVGLRPGRRALGHVASGATTGLVKNEPALQVSWSAASRTMPLPRAQRQDGLADVGERRPLALLDAEGAGELGVARPGRRGVPWRELEGDLEDDVAAGVGLERG